MTDYVSLQDVTKTYRMGEITIKAADGISFDVQKGEFVIVVGPSGAGKTTVLNILGGMDVATSGKVFVDGAEITKYRGKKLIQYRREEIGFVFQFYNLMQNLTALENVALPLMFKGVGKEEREAKAMEMLKLVGIDNRYTHKPKEMSGGQQQRVGIARAFVTDPSVVFADEPTGNLDSKTTIEVMDLIKQLVYTKKQTLVMVTHDANVAKYSDITVNISDGRITSKKYNS